MKSFLKKLLLWALPLIILFAVLGRFADGNTDDNYRHFTTKGSSIIMGDSRGAQAIVPYVLDKNFPQHKFDNFALNIVHSPYGPVYLKALKRKLDTNTRNGIFILTVDPWNVSISKSTTALKDFPENKGPLYNMRLYGVEPNYEYLLKNYSQSWFLIYRDREEQGRSSTYLHKNGWMEVNVNVDSDSVAKRTVEKVDFYKKLAKGNEISEERLKTFTETISFLKKYGKVYIVRIPASEGIMNIEKNYIPNFNSIMEKIAHQNNIKYFDFSNQYDNYIYTDGNHMYKESGKILTQQIADSIKMNQLK